MNKQLTVIESVETRIQAFAAVLPSHISAHRFIAAFKTSAMTNPDLLKVPSRGVVLAVMQAASDGLLPDGKDAAIVVRRGREGYTATYQRMAQGLIKLLYRTKLVSTVSLNVIREDDEWDYALGDGEFIDHKPSLSIRGELVAAYSIITMKDGTKNRCLMGREEIERIMMMSPQGWDKDRQEPKGMWKNHTAEMWKKTVLHRHVKILSLEGMPSTVADDEIGEIEDAAWLEPEDYTQQPVDEVKKVSAQESPPDDATSRTEASNPLGDYWAAELNKLHESLALCTSVPEAEEAYNEWDAEHENISADVMEEVGKITSRHVERIKALLKPRKGAQTADDYSKAKNG